ncbi:MAG: inositol 2-dehydrogenase [Pseudomonadota bacterium]
MANEKIQFAVLGAGRIGQVHARTIAANSDAQLTCIADAAPQAAQAIADRYGCEIATIDDIADNSAIDAVVICTPTDTHADLIEQFARTGKAIFCEKPIDLDVGRVRTCLTAIERTGTPVMVGFNRRFDPHFAAVKTAITDGKIGDVELVQITSRDPGPPGGSYIKVSGGIFRDMMIHDFDMARFLLGEEPVRVQASGSVLVNAEIGELGDYDTASALLTTGSGKQCVITNSRRAAYGYDQRIEVHGSKGAITAENQRPVDIEIATAGGYTRPPLHDFFMDRYVDAFAIELAAFIAALREDRAPNPSGEDGLRALLIADAAVKSAQSGQAGEVRA